MVLVLSLCGAALLLALAGLFAFGLRRRLLQRSGGTFDCNLRWNAPAPTVAYAEEPKADAHSGSGPGSGGRPAGRSGKGWAYGIARYNGDQIEWFRVFSYAPRPRRFLERNRIEVLQRRDPEGEEELALLSDAVILACSLYGTRVELAMSEDALTGFLAWLEAAPPGQRVNVA
ncbi:hypothetical protein DB35_12960 [Streptomyces abyssalis]|uniref:DUF2550 domain-containing protein n=1 Tax=Streptomyces abyssalis TaxID=933944 RepID=A0A1E7JIS2_9ACTN|nr:DUF2550 domain-containing protein [Streptomyces abyssalis]OEU86347.1 hypothetical protein AN215_25020 [Streptomyces abyssalis]OEU93303.1 hypothetical protein DB35_12960 [Streptomyces abyssalis]OEV31216.1 hypothetical protein AN219_06340 [Streptomyces nanshensis]